LQLLNTVYNGANSNDAVACINEIA